MLYTYFNRENVLQALHDKGYFIHTETSNTARTEATALCKDLSKCLNELHGYENNEENENRIYVYNSEVPPACNYGVIKRNDQFPFEPLTEDTDLNLLMKEIESTRLKN